ncbi:hypothetical protein F2Q69_00063654 [Brassica cretica]|uniref:AMP-activated protein kinase glycogen-binding domain-containing protein n=1 Tax=Brassica cretica TaxID=69181 RepID=A0A8S9RBQ5_BRACR|nr:hypothetical protein F2Q69_00063654 [Brassica cretica]
MFGSTLANNRGNSAASAQLVTPTRFVWPYGGTRVFLSGSFTRWTEHVPMSPLEGCPSVFQVICNLTPGYHQVNNLFLLRVESLLEHLYPYRLSATSMLLMHLV